MHVLVIFDNLFIIQNSEEGSVVLLNFMTTCSSCLTHHPCSFIWYDGFPSSLVILPTKRLLTVFKPLSVYCVSERAQLCAGIESRSDGKFQRVELRIVR